MILRIGSQKNANFTLQCSLLIKWSDRDVDILGIQIPKERNHLTPIHFYRKFAKIDKILLPWKGKYLWKNHRSNQLTYLVLPTPSDLLFSYFFILPLFNQVG